MFIELQEETGIGLDSKRPLALALTHILAVTPAGTSDLTKITMCGGGEYLVAGEYSYIFARLRHATESLLKP